MLERKWIYGGPWDIWIRYAGRVNELVSQFKLQPVTTETLRSGKAQMQEEAVRFLRPRPFPGYIRAAHFHLGDEVFLADKEAWTAFSQGVMEDVTRKLSSAKHVNFEQLMGVADAAEALH